MNRPQLHQGKWVVSCGTSQCHTHKQKVTLSGVKQYFFLHSESVSYIMYCHCCMIYKQTLVYLNLFLGDSSDCYHGDTLKLGSV